MVDIDDPHLHQDPQSLQWQIEVDGSFKKPKPGMVSDKDEQFQPLSCFFESWKHGEKVKLVIDSRREGFPKSALEHPNLSLGHRGGQEAVGKDRTA
ncbi:hypothetical protein N9F34_00415 [Alphaproteobacteria bacterium]|nr:hypothetical protein [Alphaproteobacteria bacterium]